VSDSALSSRGGATCSGKWLQMRVPHGVIFSQEKLELEDATLVGRLRGAGDDDIKVAQVILVGGGADARSW
jgi:hypothetical protein